MDSYNILILSAGRRVELVNCFKRAAKRLKIKSKIFAGDCQQTAPALFFADRMSILPKISSPDYIDTIIQVCNDYEVALIIPTIDTELLPLAKNREKIESRTKARVLVSDQKVIEICRNKICTQNFLEQYGFNVPHCYNEDELVSITPSMFPLFVKPVDGSSSINTFKINNKKELEGCLVLVKNPIVQDFIVGKEFTIDAFLDFNSNIITIVPRLRLATRGGEISKGRIIKDREIINEVARMLTLLKPIGPVTIQCIQNEESLNFIEINPRFGGGAPMSIESGADSCENLYRLLMGEKLIYNENYQEDLLFLRFDRTICLNEKMEVLNYEICNDLADGTVVQQ